MKVLKTISLVFLSCISIIGNSQNMQEHYQHAESYLYNNIKKKVKNIWVSPNWIENSNDFWYTEQTADGNQYRIYEAKKRKSKSAFNHEKLAQFIEGITEQKVNPDSLNLSQLEFIDGKKKIKIELNDLEYIIDLKSYSAETKEKEENKKYQSKSPDGKWMVEVRDYNLFLTNTETSEETQLTSDGIKRYEYATPVSWSRIVDITVEEKYDPKITVYWSDDSKKFLTYKMDRREIGDLYLYQSMPDSGMRAKVWSYERALPGEPAHSYEFFIFNTDKKTKVKIDIPPVVSHLTSTWPSWFKNNYEIYFSIYNRGYKNLTLYSANAETGAVKLITKDESETMVEMQMANLYWYNNESKFTWTSEKSGWNQIYKYDKDGNELGRLTSGEFVVQSVVYIDEENDIIYFIAKGAEADRDPYYSYLYRINGDGSNMQLLTPENADHNISISPEHNYFVDNYSTIDSKPVSVFRSLKEGTVISKIVEANIDDLIASGWRYPKPFKVKARDGKTAIYGAIFYPSHFDSNKIYPVIDGTYSGPQAVRTPKTFNRAYTSTDVSLAELGFIVINIDGLGSAWRSKEFHDYSYMNLGDIGAEDHIAAIKQLARKYSYIDSTKVGIYGHSAGGYDAARALLTHPEFYSVAVSSAGNHHHSIAKAWWPEQYMGMPGNHYEEQSNFALANNLQGKLLLVHGDMDYNVNTTSSLRLAAELIKHNKDFELLIIPNQGHGIWHPYFFRKRWDWFVKHLKGVEPPKEYKITSY